MITLTRIHCDIELQEMAINPDHIVRLGNDRCGHGPCVQVYDVTGSWIRVAETQEEIRDKIAAFRLKMRGL